MERPAEFETMAETIWEGDAGKSLNKRVFKERVIMMIARVIEHQIKAIVQEYEPAVKECGCHWTAFPEYSYGVSLMLKVQSEKGTKSETVMWGMGLKEMDRDGNQKMLEGVRMFLNKCV
jgi:hypothetical protein